MNFDNFYFNKEPNPISYERCNPKNLNINNDDNNNDDNNNDDDDDENDENILEQFSLNNNNLDMFGKDIPLWAEITIFFVIGIIGIIGLVYLVKFIEDKKLNKEINNHSFRKKHNSYTNNNYNKNKLF